MLWFYHFFLWQVKTELLRENMYIPDYIIYKIIKVATNSLSILVVLFPIPERLQEVLKEHQTACFCWRWPLLWASGSSEAHFKYVEKAHTVGWKSVHLDSFLVGLSSSYLSCGCSNARRLVRIPCSHSLFLRESAGTLPPSQEGWVSLQVTQDSPEQIVSVVLLDFLPACWHRHEQVHEWKL